jgi:hypothetical protein
VKQSWNKRHFQKLTLLILQCIECVENYIAVDSVRNVIIDGVELKRLYCSRFASSDEGIFLDLEFEITERLGALTFSMNDYNHCLLDAFAPIFVHYSASEINEGAECFNIIISNDEIITTNISIYPNPASFIISVEADDEIIGINIMDYSGRIMKIVNNKFDRIDVSDLSRGIYLFEIKVHNGVLWEKVIVN